MPRILILVLLIGAIGIDARAQETPAPDNDSSEPGSAASELAPSDVAASEESEAPPDDAASEESEAPPDDATSEARDASGETATQVGEPQDPSSDGDEGGDGTEADEFQDTDPLFQKLIGAGGEPSQPDEPSQPEAPTESEPEDVPTTALDFYGVALERELDGDAVGAVGMLRRAHQLRPDDELIAFDLARVAFELRVDGWEGDVAPLLAMEQLSTAGPDAHVLRGHIFLALRRETEARREVDEALAWVADHPGALQLRAALPDSELDTAAAGLRVEGRARLGLDVDTNVRVDGSEGASEQLGVRPVFDATATVSHPRSPIEGGGYLYFGPHLNARDDEDLGELDASTLALFASSHFQRNAATVSPSLALSQTWTDDFGKSFLSQIQATIPVWFPVGATLGGTYVGLGYRDFHSAAGNLEGKSVDRDGLQSRAGVTALWRQQRLSLRGSLGAQWERARKEFSEAGAEALLRGELRIGETLGVLELGYEQRAYYDSTADRSDHRIRPRLIVTQKLTEQVGALASISFTRNVSSDPEFDYQRVIAHLGAEVTF